MDSLAELRGKGPWSPHASGVEPLVRTPSTLQMTPRLAPKTLRVVCTRRFLTDQEEEGAGDPWAPPVPGGDSDPRHPPHPHYSRPAPWAPAGNDKPEALSGDLPGCPSPRKVGVGSGSGRPRLAKG